MAVPTSRSPSSRTRTTRPCRRTSSGSGTLTNAGGSWLLEKASPGADFAAAGVAIALDAAGSPVIVHANAAQSKLLRIRRVGGAWTTDTMYNGIAIREPSILLDPGGALQAAIAGRATTDGSGTRIVHVRGTTGAWAVTSVTNGATVRLVPSIGRTVDGTIWIAEWEVDQGVRVHRRHPSTGAWTQTAITDDPAAVLPTLAVDAAGVVHVAYSNANFYGSAGCSVPECAEGPGLLHAVLVGSTWQTTRLTPRWQDTSSVLARGGDGGLSVAFLRTGHGVRLLELIPGKPTATLRLRAESDTGVSPSDGITNAPVPTWDVTFNRPVTGLTAGDFTRSGTATGCVVGTPTGSGATWAVSLSGCSTGTVALGLKAGSVADAEAVAGPNAPVAAATVTVDRIGPTAAPPTATLRAGALLSGTNLPVASRVDRSRRRRGRHRPIRGCPEHRRRRVLDNPVVIARDAGLRPAHRSVRDGSLSRPDGRSGRQHGRLGDRSVACPAPPPADQRVDQVLRNVVDLDLDLLLGWVHPLCEGCWCVRLVHVHRSERRLRREPLDDTRQGQGLRERRVPDDGRPVRVDEAPRGHLAGDVFDGGHADDQAGRGGHQRPAEDRP